MKTSSTAKATLFLTSRRQFRLLTRSQVTNLRRIKMITKSHDQPIDHRLKRSKKGLKQLQLIAKNVSKDAKRSK